MAWAYFQYMEISSTQLTLVVSVESIDDDAEEFVGVGGFGFIARNFVLVLAPSYASNLLLLPMLIAGLSLMAWLLVKGVDVARWEERKGLKLDFEKAT